MGQMPTSRELFSQQTGEMFAGPLISPRTTLPRILWLGNAVLPAAFETDLFSLFGKETGQLKSCSLADLENDWSVQARPDAVVSTLFWREGDVLDATRILCRKGFVGPYRALTPPLPRKRIIEKEVRALCPLIDFEVIEVTDGMLGRACAKIAHA